MRSIGIKKVTITGFMILLFAVSTLTAQEFKDADGNVYRTVKYGLQVWTASNLNVSHFRNGDEIPQAQSPEEWAKAALDKKPAWCYYENDLQNGRKYGKLYNWYAVNDPRGLAPAGWHITINEDWRMLVNNLKGIDVASAKLKSPTEWKSKKGTNDIGFSAFPSGHREKDGKFRDLGTVCMFWSNSVPVSVKPSDKIYAFTLSDNTYEVQYLQSEKGAGLSVRCEKD
jgi:uncharacterized protein (TIGR02145 family)